MPWAVFQSSNNGSMEVKTLLMILLFVLSASITTGHAETVYKLKDDSGATVYSDRQDLQGTTEAATVKLAPGPSAEDQQAAEQRVQSMRKESDTMQKARLDKEKHRNKTQEMSNTDVREIESSGVGVIDQRPRDPKERIPSESRDGGEHPIYEPNKERPVHIAPRPRPRVGR